MSDLIESEWTDKFGRHYEVLGKDQHGRIHSRVIIHDPLLGWTVTWDEVRASVRASIDAANRTPAKSRELPK